MSRMAAKAGAKEPFSCKKLLLSYKYCFTSLSSCPRELWIIYVLKVGRVGIGRLEPRWRKGEPARRGVGTWLYSH